MDGGATFLLASLDYCAQEALLITKKLIKCGKRSAGLTNNGSNTDAVETLVQK